MLTNTSYLTNWHRFQNDDYANGIGWYENILYGSDTKPGATFAIDGGHYLDSKTAMDRIIKSYPDKKASALSILTFRVPIWKYECK